MTELNQFVHDDFHHVWINILTLVTINCEDMPVELIPEKPLTFRKIEVEEQIKFTERNDRLKNYQFMDLMIGKILR